MHPLHTSRLVRDNWNWIYKLLRKQPYCVSCTSINIRPAALCLYPIKQDVDQPIVPITQWSLVPYVPYGLTWNYSWIRDNCTKAHCPTLYTLLQSYVLVNELYIYIPGPANCGALCLNCQYNRTGPLCLMC